MYFFSLGVYNGPDRTGLAVDIQAGPNIAACCCVNGRGLSIFDLRMPLPLDFIYDVSYSLARITFLDDINEWSGTIISSWLEIHSCDDSS